MDASIPYIKVGHDLEILRHPNIHSLVPTPAPFPTLLAPPKMSTSLETATETPRYAVDLPTLDFSKFRGPNATPESKAQVVAALQKAATDHGNLFATINAINPIWNSDWYFHWFWLVCGSWSTGFLYLTNHGLPKDLIDAAFNVGKGFFSEVPEEVRRDPRWAFGNDYVCLDWEASFGLFLTWIATGF